MAIDWDRRAFTCGAAAATCALIFANTGWNSPWSHDALIGFAGFSAAFVAAAFVARFLCKAHAGGLLAALLAAWFFVGLGPAPVFGVGLLALTAHALGSLAYRAAGQSSHTRAGTAPLLLGCCLLLAFSGAALAWPVNSRASHFTVGLGVLTTAWFAFSGDWRQRILRDTQAWWRWLQRAPYWPLAVFLFCLAWVGSVSFYPSIGYDDNAHHLRMWTELATQGKYSFDIHSQIWAIAPFANNLGHSLASLQAGTDARSAWNALLFVLLIRETVLLTSWLRVRSGGGLLAGLLIATTPMAASVLLTLQTELMLAWALVTGLRCMLAPRPNAAPASAVASLGVLAAAALCVGLKLPGAVIASALLACAAILAFRRNERPWPLTNKGWSSRAWWAITVAVLAAAALQAYVIAWIKTGNPVFPLYNGVFKSPFYAPINFSDLRWVLGFDLLTFWRVFWEQQRFFEAASNFSAGFHYLIAPLLAFLFVWPRAWRRRALMVVIAVVFGFGLVMFSQTQYWRYMFPVFAAAGVALVGVRTLLPARAAAGLTGLLIACVGVNLYFLPGASWMLSAGQSLQWRVQSQNDWRKQFGAELVLTEEVNRRATNRPRVLYPPTNPSGAQLHGAPVYVNWYAPGFQRLYEQATTPAAVASFVRDHSIEYVITNIHESIEPNTPSDAWMRYLAAVGEPIRIEGAFALYGVRPASAAGQSTQGSAPLVLARGERVRAVDQPRVLQSALVGSTRFMHYAVRLRCQTPGVFNAQINWDAGQPYYRLVQCQAGVGYMEDILKVPTRATRAEVYLSARDNADLAIEELSVSAR